MAHNAAPLNTVQKRGDAWHRRGSHLASPIWLQQAAGGDEGRVVTALKVLQRQRRPGRVDSPLSHDGPQGSEDRRKPGDGASGRARSRGEFAGERV